MTKNGFARSVPLSTRAIEALRSLRPETTSEDVPVFGISEGALEQAWMRLRSRARVGDLRFHDLRHEGVSRLFERGLSLIEASSISGHRELKMLARYTHIDVSQIAMRL